MAYTGVVALVVADIICGALALMVYRSSQTQTIRGISLSWAFGLATVVFVIHVVGVFFAVSDIGLLFGFLVSLATGAVPFILTGWVVQESLSSKASNFILGDERDAVPIPRMEAAHDAMRHGDYATAMAEYQKLARDFPNAPEPLFGMETLHSQAGRFEEAAAVCREISRRFKLFETEWVKATRRLSEILRDHLDDPVAADKLLQEIKKRNPDARFGYMKQEQKKAIQHAPERKGAYHGTADLEQARRLAKTGSPHEAVALFKRHYKDSSRDPRHLFEAAHALQRAELYHDALGLLQEIVRQHGTDDEVWGRATLELATIHETHLGDAMTAESILIEVQRRVPYGEPARMARDRLKRLRGEA